MNEGLARARERLAAIGSSAPLRWVRRHKRALAIAVLVLVAVFIAVYVAVRPEIVGQVLAVGPAALGWLTGLYVLIVATHWAILLLTVRWCQARIGIREGLLLTVYSTVANFFGPLQSGPGVRAAYLKAKVGVRLRDFTLATLVYYLAFGAVNVSLLFARTLPWLAALGLATTVVLVAVVAWRSGAGRRIVTAAIAAVTAVQALLMAAVYFVELNAVSGPGADVLQSLVYSASANLSLFVSITPGAIGFREAFLGFAQSLHGVGLDAIIAAGIVDRAFYVLFLGALFVLSSLLNLRAMFSAPAGGDADAREGGAEGLGDARA
ncbi:hypothetical protein [Agrococcus sp. BE272]|uniref:hypothetical protein n=1 Tax=Agrococcus sp. BE272 TaxID=2817727 RepID=UPI00285A9FFA|nr:hypothetical protein [Agrococcus sp. BE272]MDR7235067.1 hypothetical protein [Agrococcus sp. BE272]